VEISEILDRASARQGTTSLRGLARAIGIDAGALLRIRDKRALPTDDTMMRICLLANVAPEEGLLLLNLWRSKGRLRTIYSRIFKIWVKANGEAGSKADKKTSVEQIHL
jgi:hypothetical protein